MKRETFICYSDRYDYCDGMTSEQKANLFDCIRSYTRVGNSIQPLPEIQFVRNRIKKQLDEHNEKYLEVCKKASENVTKRREKAKKYKDIQPNTTVYESIPNILDTDTDTDTVNDTIINSPIGEQQSGQIVAETKTYGDPAINDLIAKLRETCDSLGVAYDKTDDRKFGNHICKAKEFGEFAEKIGSDRIKFACDILIASKKIGYRKGPCAGPMKIYQNYADVYNKTLDRKESKQENRIGVVF